MNQYSDRYEAGKILATLLRSYANQSDVIVLALPRGGVPVAYEIAQALSVSLDILIVRKLGVPGHEELAMGALVSGGVAVFNQDIIHELNISQSTVERVIQFEQQELARRERAYRGNKPFPSLAGKTIIIVDDGIATGATLRAAIGALREDHPKSIIVAVPVAASSICEGMENVADKVICPLKPRHLDSVGMWYKDFSQTTDEEVFKLLVNRSE